MVAGDVEEAGPGPDQGQEGGGGALQPRHRHRVRGVQVGQRGEGGHDDGHVQTRPKPRGLYFAFNHPTLGKGSKCHVMH